MLLADFIQTLPEPTHGVQLWIWGPRPWWDSQDREHQAWAKLTGGGLIPSAHTSADVEQACNLNDVAGSAIRACRIYGYHMPKSHWKPEGQPRPQPEYTIEVRDELNKIKEMLIGAVREYGGRPLTDVFLDVEEWGRCWPTIPGVSRRDHLLRVAERHSDVLEVVRENARRARVHWYNHNPVHKGACTLLECVDAPSGSLYSGPDQAYLTYVQAYQHARHLCSTTMYISLDSGWDEDHKWLNEGRSSYKQSYQTGALFRSYTNQDVHDVVLYEGFRPENPTFTEHLFRFLNGLYGRKINEGIVL